MRRIALAACVLSSAGCSIDLPVVGAGGTLQSGRSVSVTSDRPYRSFRMDSVGGDTESIRLGTVSPRKILVEPTSITVDGEPVATIPASTKEVTVAEDDGRLRIAADGDVVYDGRL